MRLLMTLCWKNIYIVSHIKSLFLVILYKLNISNIYVFFYYVFIIIFLWFFMKKKKSGYASKVKLKLQSKLIVTSSSS